MSSLMHFCCQPYSEEKKKKTETTCLLSGAKLLKVIDVSTFYWDGNFLGSPDGKCNLGLILSAGKSNLSFSRNNKLQFVVLA